MKESDKYLKIVEWSEEDQSYVGKGNIFDRLCSTCFWSDLDRWPIFLRMNLLSSVKSFILTTEGDVRPDAFLFFIWQSRGQEVFF